MLGIKTKLSRLPGSVSHDETATGTTCSVLACPVYSARLHDPARERHREAGEDGTASGLWTGVEERSRDRQSSGRGQINRVYSPPCTGTCAAQRCLLARRPQCHCLKGEGLWTVRPPGSLLLEILQLLSDTVTTRGKRGLRPLPHGVRRTSL